MRVQRSVVAVGVALAGVCSVAGGAEARLRPAGGEWPPVVAAWFWTQADLEPDGFRPFLDAVAAHTPYTLLSTACRRLEVTDPAMHAQAGQAVRYANALGLKIALEVDIRLARQAFRAAYPGELQEELVLRTATFTNGVPSEVSFVGTDTRDHMNGSLPDYVCLTTRLLRAYSYRRGPAGIDSSTVADITGTGVAAVAEGPRKLTVRIAPQDGREVCVMAVHTVLTPDVFAPHLLEFQRGIVRQYADLPLAGIMKDEWGFPPDHTGNPGHDRYWYSDAMSSAYSQLSGGNDLVRDALLMCVGEAGRERERAAAINRYCRMCRERNVAIEDDFYRAAKVAFGGAAYVVTHATWTPYPGAQEFRKNGLSWWDATRDIGQSDESTPYACRTSLAKRWGYPLEYNQYYAKTVEPYVAELWRGALSGGRLNVHPLYPRQDLKGGERERMLLRSGLMAGMARMRVLDFISRAPLDCPVAVVFGHACAMNWAQPSYNDVGLGVASALGAQGFLADLVPSSLVAARALRLDAEGYVCLGEQRYRAVVLHQPEFCGAEERAFFARAAAGKSALFQLGAWTCDEEARPHESAPEFRGRVRLCRDGDSCVAEVAGLLEQCGVERVSPWVATAPRWGHSGGALATPPTEGHTRLTDGTCVRAAGTKNPSGDPILETFQWQGRAVSVDAVGAVAIRFASDGKVAAFAAGGLKRVETHGLSLELSDRLDLAFRTEPDGRVRGMVQGLDAAAPVPAALLALTDAWERLSMPPTPE